MKRTVKRIGSGLLALTLVLGLFLGSMGNVFAGDTYPYVGESAEGDNQPTLHGYRVEDLMQWSPETDPYAEMLRAQVPLQNRNAAFTATQANPNLTPLAQYLTLTGDYGNSFFNSDAYTNEFSTHVFNFWQYVDQYASWHGMPSVGTPEELNDVKDERNATDGNAWMRRNFEFGLVNLPNPAYTNAAHKNGVLSLGCMFQPRAYQNFEVMLYKDENGRYPVADKLTEMAKYYGFDGYFFNMEGRYYSAAAREQLKTFFAQMRADGMYIQWYNAGSFSTDMLTSATKDNYEGATPYANSSFIEYGRSVPGDEGTTPYGLDKYEAAFNGYEAGRDRWRNKFTRMMKDGVMNGSIASLGTDFVQTGLEKNIRQDAETGYNLFSRELDEYQWMAFERERLWWTGNSNSNTTNVNAGLTGTAGDIDASNFTGIADYIAERSVVRGDTFYTNFNTGHGLEYKLNGELSSSSEWSNINLQDILPTWQWWFETNGTKLKAEFDYGSKYRKVYYSGEEGQFGFDLVGAYNGGSSLAVYGALDAENFLHLYKSDLDVSKDSKMAITFRKTSEDTAAMKLGLIFADDTEKIVKLDIANSEKKSADWVTSTVDLSAYAGKKIAAFGLVFEGEAQSYQMNIGQLRFTSGADVVPEAPTGFKVVKAFEDGEMTVSWNMESYDKVKQYNLYALVGGHELFLGGIYDENYYIKNVKDAIADAAADYIESVTVSPKESNATAGDTLDFSALVNGYHEDAGQVTLVIKAVSADGTESEGTLTTYNYGEAVKNVTVDNSTDGQLVLTWEGGEADVTVTTDYEKETRKWTASGTNGCTVTVPTGKDADGAYVTVRITRNGVTTAVDTRLPDKYCAPYDGRIYPSDRRLTQPMSSDWHIIRYQTVTDGNRGDTVEVTRGVGRGVTNDHAVFTPISGTADGVYVWLEDYAGNLSEEVYVPGALSVTVIAEQNSVQAGATLQLSVTVRNYTKTDEVIWSISGNGSAETKIDENGLLTVAEAESASRIAVTASSKEEPAASSSVNITVLPAYAIYPNSGNVYQGETQQFYVQHKGENLEPAKYNWKVEPWYTWSGLSAGTTIDENGLLTVSSDESTYGLRVTATSKEDPNVSYTSGRFRPQIALSISSGASTINAGKTMQFTAAYKGEAAGADVIAWSVTGAAAEGTKIDENGLLTVSEAETSTTITVTATSRTNSNLTASKTLSVEIPVNIEGCVSVGATILGASGNGNYNEEKEKALDGKEETKWCTNGKTGWLAIDLGKSYTINRWRTVHGEKGDKESGFNTKIFALEVLKNPDASASDLANASYLGNKDNWTEVELVDNGTDALMVVDHTLATPVTGRYFRLRIDDSCINQWTAVRIHEFQLYGEEAAAGASLPMPAPVPVDTDPIQKVFWTVEGAKSADTKIDGNGKLTIGIDEPEGVLTVKAVSALDETKFDTAIVNVTAKAKYTVTVIAGKGGKVEPGTGEYYEGAEVEYTFTPDKGYELDKVLLNGQEVEVKDNKGTLTVLKDTKLEASFKQIMHTVTVEAGKGGKVEPGTGEYAEGSEVTFTVKADKGYEADKVTVNGKEVSLKDGKFTVIIEGKTDVKVTFKAVKNPTTGDSFNPMYTVLLTASALAALAAGAFLFLRKKNHN